MPQYYKEPFDRFIGLTAAAVATTKIKLGTSISIVPEHHPINLAKMIATLDRVSNGRFLFGIGGGWNAAEMANHGVELKNRFQVTRERILAMKEIWTRAVAGHQHRGLRSSLVTDQLSICEAAFRKGVETAPATSARRVERIWQTWHARLMQIKAWAAALIRVVNSRSQVNPSICPSE